MNIELTCLIPRLLLKVTMKIDEKAEMRILLHVFIPAEGIGNMEILL